jgi:hypothetical protein
VSWIIYWVLSSREFRKHVPTENLGEVNSEGEKSRTFWLKENLGALLAVYITCFSWRPFPCLRELEPFRKAVGGWHGEYSWLELDCLWPTRPELAALDKFGTLI